MIISTKDKGGISMEEQKEEFLGVYREIAAAAIKNWYLWNLEEDEAKRILKKGGRIKPFIDENGIEIAPPRVWVKDDDVPGLAMTRSFGDRVASIAGTICVPEIKEYYFNEGDKFVVIASDGVWEYLENKNVCHIVKSFFT